MEPIRYFYESIDRNAIIIKPKEAFFNWVNSVYPENNIEEKPENNIYLVHEMDSNEEILVWIKANYEMIFINELNDWYTGEDKWPANRTFKMFSDWFEIEICSMVLDLEENEITKE
mgnify:CR=1 FL=1